MRYLNTKEQGKADLTWFIIVLIIYSIFHIRNDIVESWNLKKLVITVISLLVIYLIYKGIEKRKKNKPTSLWKEFEKKYPIVIQYAPPKWINPAEAWLLYNLKVEPTDLTSMIYQWKYENLIDIKTFKWNNSDKEYVKLIKLDDIPLTRPFFESEIFDSIFASSDIKVIEWAFQLRYALMLEDLEIHWIKKWWVEKISWWKKFDRIYSLLVGLFIACIIILLSWKAIQYSWYLIWISLFLFLLCTFAWWYMYGWWDLKFTDKWAKLASYIIWYRNFIKSCDENKIKLFLKQDPLFVDKTLPYATAFWLETEFLKKVSPLIKDWNAKYIMWQKVTIWMRILGILFSGSNNDRYEW